MNVVHVSIADDVGGAARSAYKIHSGLRHLGVRSRMLVGYKFTADPDVRAFRELPWRIVDRPFQALTDALALQYLFLPSTLRLAFHPWMRDADIVQLYNLHGGYVSYVLLLGLLGRRKRIVLRLSDMWALTGHCAYSLECERWRTGCGRCPHLKDYPGLTRDRTAANWRIKRWLYSRVDLCLVAPSRWIERLAAQSPLLGRFPITWIPNGVDTDVFVPRDRARARAALGLPSDGRYVLFSATEARKGGSHLARALREARAAVPDLRLITVGAESSAAADDLPGTHLGVIRDDATLALAYAAADVFALPAVADNLPNTVLESLAAGTAVVAYAVGGVPEAVRHLETGYLIAAGDASGLARGLVMLLRDDQLRERIARRAREVAEREYSLALQARRFADLYAALPA